MSGNVMRRETTARLAPTDRAASSSSGLTCMSDDEMRRIAEECQVQAEKLLEEHRPQLDALAKALLRNDSLDEQEILKVTGIKQPPAEPVAAAALTR